MIDLGWLGHIEFTWHFLVAILSITLIDLVLSRYGQHPCVAGFGIDIEWYQQNQYFEGKAISDEKAQTWSSQVRSYNQDYILFLKHWLPEKMPPDYRQGLVFVDDSQKFITLNEMAAEFEHWGNTFSPSPVAFQFGYKSDQRWWEEYNDPPLEIGKLLLSRIPNLAGLFWVDFTAAELWPVPPSN